MLLHAILLLLGSLAIAESDRPCLSSLIKGVKSDEINIESHDGKLRVKCSKDLFYITMYPYDDFFDSMTCDAEDGWIGNSNYVYPSIANRTDTIETTDVRTYAHKPVTISCVDLSHCNPSLFKQANPEKFKFFVEPRSQFKRELSCGGHHNASVGILVKDGDREERYRSMYCNKEGWSGYHLDGGRKFQNFGKNISSTLSCFDYCHVIWETGLTISYHTTIPGVKSYYCVDSSHQLFFNGVPAEYNSMSCSMWDGWRSHETRDTVHGHSPFTPQHVECKSGPTQGGKRSVRAMRIAEGNQEE